jgi:membrane-associated phospholipid phosphatase
MLLDAPLRDVYRSARDEATDAFARAARPLGGPSTYVSVGMGLLAVGLVGQNQRVLEAGARVSTSLIMTGVLTRAGKYAAGRERPAGGRGNHFFEPLSDKTSLPSGHSAMAFALATSLADEIDRPWAAVVLYAAASATAWSRLNDDIHWTSDVLAGAVLGRQCAKFVGRRLRFDGGRPPMLLPYEDGVAVAWTVGL